ncbi:hypothetical protein [Actinocatenispora thailandica]|nr:hypothetical protein [Actinocatenispora thailandica]
MNEICPDVGELASPNARSSTSREPDTWLIGTYPEPLAKLACR